MYILSKNKLFFCSYGRLRIYLEGTYQNQKELAVSFQLPMEQWKPRFFPNRKRIKETFKVFFFTYCAINCFLL